MQNIIEVSLEQKVLDVQMSSVWLQVEMLSWRNWEKWAEWEKWEPWWNILYAKKVGYIIFLGNGTASSTVWLPAAWAWTWVTRTVWASPFPATIRKQWYLSGATAWSTAWLRSTALQFMRWNVYANGCGFYLNTVFGINHAAAVANARCFVGMCKISWAPTSVAINTLVNCIGVWYESWDANFSIYHNDSAGLCTKIPLWVDFPANTLWRDMYKLEVLALPNDYKVTVKITNMKNKIEFVQVISTDLPVHMELLCFNGYIDNGSTALWATIDFSHMYIESDFDLPRKPLRPAFKFPWTLANAWYILSNNDVNVLWTTPKFFRVKFRPWYQISDFPDSNIIAQMPWLYIYNRTSTNQIRVRYDAGSARETVYMMGLWFRDEIEYIWAYQFDGTNYQTVLYVNWVRVGPSTHTSTPWSSWPWKVTIWNNSTNKLEADVFEVEYCSWTITELEATKLFLWEITIADVTTATLLTKYSATEVSWNTVFDLSGNWNHWTIIWNVTVANA